MKTKVMTMIMSEYFNDELKLLSEKILLSDNIGLISHVNPDGDSIGSLLALGLALKEIKGSGVKLIKSDDLPRNFSFLSGIEHIEELKQDEEFDLLIMLDCGDQDRIGNKKTIIELAKNVVNIDHHKSNQKYGDLNIVDIAASSTGEIVYKILEDLNFSMNNEIATCLYVAISTDTGSFKYDNTSAETHLIASELMKYDIDTQKITSEIYQSKSVNKVKLFINSLNTLELMFDGKLAVVSITEKMLKENNASSKDVNGIVEFIRDIDTVEVACVLKEKLNAETRIGLRSKRYVDVAKIAENFNGGGHAKAAGCTMLYSIEESKDILIKEIARNLR